MQPKISCQRRLALFPNGQSREKCSENLSKTQETTVFDANYQCQYHFWLLFEHIFRFDFDPGLEPTKLFDVKKLTVDITENEQVVPYRQTHAEKNKMIQRVKRRQEKRQARNYLNQPDTILRKLGEKPDRTLVYSLKQTDDPPKSPK